jgi:glycolate oxidase FAD binding subunit
MDQVLQQFRDRIASAQRSGTALRIRGNGTKDWYGQELNGEVLDTTGIAASFPTILPNSLSPHGLVPTLREIGKALAEKKQMLAFEPPRFDGLATVGGIVASGLVRPASSGCGIGA